MVLVARSTQIMYTEFYSENLKGTVDVRDLGIEGRVVIKGS